MKRVPMMQSLDDVEALAVLIEKVIRRERDFIPAVVSLMVAKELSPLLLSISTAETIRAAEREAIAATLETEAKGLRAKAIPAKQVCLERPYLDEAHNLEKAASRIRARSETGREG